MVNRFVLNGISYHGKGAIQEIPEIIKGKGLKKAFIASDPDLVKLCEIGRASCRERVSS